MRGGQGVFTADRRISPLFKHMERLGHLLTRVCGYVCFRGNRLEEDDQRVAGLDSKTAIILLNGATVMRESLYRMMQRIIFLAGQLHEEGLSKNC